MATHLNYCVADSMGMAEDGHRSDEEQADNDDEEDDAAWRKQRHEREMFLKEQREVIWPCLFFSLFFL